MKRVHIILVENVRGCFHCEFKISNTRFIGCHFDVSLPGDCGLRSIFKSAHCTNRIRDSKFECFDFLLTFFNSLQTIMYDQIYKLIQLFLEQVLLHRIKNCKRANYTNRFRGSKFKSFKSLSSFFIYKLHFSVTCKLIQLFHF